MKMRNINLVFFSLFLVFLISLPILCVDRYLSHQDIPWQLTPFNVDSLSQHYKERFDIMKPYAVVSALQDSSKPLVMILIDGWGVPYKEDMLEKDFEFFPKNKNTSFAIRKRLLQNTSHAENVEYVNGFAEGVFLENGDSVACAKSDREQAFHFKQTLCCENCSDVRAVATLDSLISLVSDTTWNRIAWTAHGTREGDRGKLHNLLDNLSRMVEKYPDIQFVIQGAHRPILGTPETRRKYLAPWVPAVFINCAPMESVVIKN